MPNYSLYATCHFSRTFPACVSTCEGRSVAELLSRFKRAFAASRFEYAHVDIFKGTDLVRSYRLFWNDSDLMVEQLSVAVNDARR